MKYVRTGDNDLHIGTASRLVMQAESSSAYPSTIGDILTISDMRP
jgi:hypothetical protein